MTREEGMSLSSALSSPSTQSVLLFPSGSATLALLPRPVGEAISLPTSSGDWITFSQVGGGAWYAETSQGRLSVQGRSHLSVGSYLAWLGTQEASLVRSRVHVIPSASSPTGAACVYLGRLGLLGGAPQHPSTARAKLSELTEAQAQTSEARHCVLHTEAFGAQAWKDYFGVDVGVEPPLPESALKVWNGECPYLLEDEASLQRVKDNHLLTLIPGTVNGQPFTLDKLGDLILANYGGHMAAFVGNTNQELGGRSHGFYYYGEHLTNANRHEALPGAPYWLLLPKTILADSRDKTFAAQKAILSEYSGTGYRLPRALEVSTSLLSHYARSKERLYANDNSRGLWTGTRCSDADLYGDPVVVGGFGAAGLDVNHYLPFCDYDVSVGAVGCWKF